MDPNSFHTIYHPQEELEKAQISRGEKDRPQRTQALDYGPLKPEELISAVSKSIVPHGCPEIDYSASYTTSNELFQETPTDYC